jgi:hypothetical protein
MNFHSGMTAWAASVAALLQARFGRSCVFRQGRSRRAVTPPFDQICEEGQKRIILESAEFRNTLERLVVFRAIASLEFGARGCSRMDTCRLTTSRCWWRTPRREFASFSRAEP